MNQNLGDVLKRAYQRETIECRSNKFDYEKVAQAVVEAYLKQLAAEPQIYPDFPSK